jgi:hypothetical protein
MGGYPVPHIHASLSAALIEMIGRAAEIVQPCDKQSRGHSAPVFWCLATWAEPERAVG